MLWICSKINLIPSFLSEYQPNLPNSKLYQFLLQQSISAERNYVELDNITTIAFNARNLRVLTSVKIKSLKHLSTYNNPESPENLKNFQEMVSRLGSKDDGFSTNQTLLNTINITLNKNANRRMLKHLRNSWKAEYRNFLRDNNTETRFPS